MGRISFKNPIFVYLDLFPEPTYANAIEIILAITALLPSLLDISFRPLFHEAISTFTLLNTERIFCSRKQITYRKRWTFYY